MTALRKEGLLSLFQGNEEIDDDEVFLKEEICQALRERVEEENTLVQSYTTAEKDDHNGGGVLEDSMHFHVDPSDHGDEFFAQKEMNEDVANLKICNNVPVVPKDDDVT